MKVLYAIVVERARRNFAAYVPDLPGCVATGATVAEAEQIGARGDRGAYRRAA